MDKTIKDLQKEVMRLKLENLLLRQQIAKLKEADDVLTKSIILKKGTEF